MKLGNMLKKLKEENRNLASTTARMNNHAEFYGNVNRGVKGGDFWEGSYVNIIGGRGVIYGSAQDDYTFTGADLVSMEPIGPGAAIPVGSMKLSSERFLLTFADGKRAQADIICNKVAAFRMTFGK